MALQKREKILLSLAGIAVLIFLFTNLLPMLKKDKPASTPAPSTLSRPQTTLTAKTPLGSQQDRVKLKSYSTNVAWNLEWKSDPFVYAPPLPEEEELSEEDADDEDVQEEETVTHEFELNGISWLNNRPTVLINDQILRPGEVIQGWVLSDVKPEYVILRRNNESIRLTFSEKALVKEKLFR